MKGGRGRTGERAREKGKGRGKGTKEQIDPWRETSRNSPMKVDPKDFLKFTYECRPVARDFLKFTDPPRKTLKNALPIQSTSRAILPWIRRR